MKAAKVDDLICLPDDPNDLQATQIRFFIPEMSSNVKISEGDEVQILKFRRNAKTNWKVHSNGSVFKIRTMKWTTTYQTTTDQPQQTGFIVEGEMVAAFSYGKSKASEYTCYALWANAETPPSDAIFNRLGESYDATQYLAINSKDMWGRNLNTLLERFNFGQSLLAGRGVTEVACAMTHSKHYRVQVFMLQRFISVLAKIVAIVSGSVQCSFTDKIYHPPDSSQENTIHTVMSHPITCIQGPQGIPRKKSNCRLTDR